jgi:hypothetical protein
MIMEALRFSETSLPTRAIRCYIPEHSFLRYFLTLTTDVMCQLSNLAVRRECR